MVPVSSFIFSIAIMYSYSCVIKRRVRKSCYFVWLCKKTELQDELRITHSRTDLKERGIPSKPSLYLHQSRHTPFHTHTLPHTHPFHTHTHTPFPHTLRLMSLRLDSHSSTDASSTYWFNTVQPIDTVIQMCAVDMAFLHTGNVVLMSWTAYKLVIRNVQTAHRCRFSVDKLVSLCVYTPHTHTLSWIAWSHHGLHCNELHSDNVCVMAMTVTYYVVY